MRIRDCKTVQRKAGKIQMDALMKADEIFRQARDQVQKLIDKVQRERLRAIERNTKKARVPRGTPGRGEHL